MTNLRGITHEIAVRLGEENIADTNALAYADPIRLVQRVPYDIRQVIDWIDQALLATTLPEHYEKLFVSGVTGAIDPSWRWLDASVKDARIRAAKEQKDLPPSFEALGLGSKDEAVSGHHAAVGLLHVEPVPGHLIVSREVDLERSAIDGLVGVVRDLHGRDESACPGSGVVLAFGRRSSWPTE